RMASVRRRLAKAKPGEVAARNAEAAAEFGRVDSHVPLWLPWSLLAAGFAVQASPSVIGGVPTEERVETAVMALLSGVTSVATIAAGLHGMHALEQRYQDLLSAATLAPVGPEGSVGLSLVGRF